MSAAARLTAVVVVVGLLAGCGDDDEPTSPDPGQGHTATGAVTQTSTATARAPIAIKRVSKLTGFSSPTGNVGCYIDKRSVRCDVRQRFWKPPPAPASCELDYGQGIAMDAGAQAGFVCAGDTALGSKQKLPYDQGLQAGVLRCVSRRTGMTCTDTNSERGFLLSRERYEVF